MSLLTQRLQMNVCGRLKPQRPTHLRLLLPVGLNLTFLFDHKPQFQQRVNAAVELQETHYFKKQEISGKSWEFTETW